MDQKEKNGEHPAGDSGQIVLLSLFLVVWALDSFLLRWTTFPAGHVSPYIRLPLMAAVLALGIILARSGHVVVNGDERPNSVVESGAFRYVRHPLYLGSLLFYLALTISTGSLVSLALLVVIFLFYNFLAGYEEKLMLKRFGDKYENYMKKTGRWIPTSGRG
jgi:protein-S-isoprenylcysteine O-methyltransferase Ste14